MMSILRARGVIRPIVSVARNLRYAEDAMRSWRSWRSWRPWRDVVAREVLHVGLVLVWIFVLQHTVSAFEVEGASMEPTLHTREFVVVDTVAPALRPPERGEVIVFRYPRNPALEYVKRVVGLPGETVSVAYGKVWVNGQPLYEPYVREAPRYFLRPVEVPEHAVFVLGDNRNSSSDSHLWGPVPLDLVIGRAWLAYRPIAGWTWLGGQVPTLQASQSP